MVRVAQRIGIDRAREEHHAQLGRLSVIE